MADRTLLVDDERLEAAEAAEAVRLWWVPVLGGILSILYAFIVLSFTIKTVWAITLFAGIGWIMIGMAELGASSVVRRGRIWHLLAGVVIIVGGVLALAWPDVTFLVLARLAAWVLLLIGVVAIVDALEQRQERMDGWWMTLVIGVAEVLVALWAVRYPGRSIVLLVLWVGVAALGRGLDLLLAGFALRSLRRAP